MPRFGIKSVFFLFLLTAALSAISLPSNAEEAKKTAGHYIFAKITAHNGDESYQVLTEAEFKELQAEISSENKSFERALNAAEAEWKKAEETRKKNFPRSAIKERKASIIQIFSDKDAAEKKLGELSKRRAEEAEQERAREKVHAKRTKEQIAEDAKKEAERKALEDKALSLFENKLNESMKTRQHEDQTKKVKQ